MENKGTDALLSYMNMIGKEYSYKDRLRKEMNMEVF